MKVVETIVQYVQEFLSISYTECAVKIGKDFLEILKKTIQNALTGNISERRKY